MLKLSKVSNTLYRVGQKTGPFLKVYDSCIRRSVYKKVQLFISSKMNILDVAMFKYSLHNFRETILHRKHQLILALKIRPFLTVCNS